MDILQRINSHEDLLKLSDDELIRLCQEIREFLIDRVSKTGGHLASNLGMVELSVALETVYDTKIDRLVFDVGHQSYVHKMLTGRQADFDHLRQFGGMAGFPKPGESITDAFVAGHASSSVSIALGMARARTLSAQDYHVVAVIGDGAATGGMAFEGLNDAAESHEPMVIILNDNEMSIDRNVGGMAKHLYRLRVKESYPGNDKPGGTGVVGLQQAVCAFDHPEAGIAKQIADYSRIVDGLPDVLLKLQVAMFIDTDLQIHLLVTRASHLKPYPGRVGKIHFKGLAGGHLIVIEDIENEVAAGAGIGIDIAENPFHIRQIPNVVDSIACTGDQIKLCFRAEGNHIRHLIANLRASLSSNVDHPRGEIHSRCLNAIFVQSFAKNSRTAGQIHTAPGLDAMQLKPSDQLLAKNLRIVIPPEFIVHLAEYVAVHSQSSRRFIASTKDASFAVISTQAGRKPLRMALRTDLILHHAAQ